MAGNQLGKTVAGAAEMAMHLTGKYPDWWTGRRFAGPIQALAGSETAEVTKKGVQRLLLGPPAEEEQWGTGFIPGDDIVSTQRKRGVADAIDTVVAKHISGRHSSVSFKSYDQGRKAWQADTVHLVWFDEEPPLEVYTEGLTRTNATGGCVYITFTPLLGMSAVVHRFLHERSDDRDVTTMALEDAPHIPAKERRRIEESYPEWEREARTKGIPALGSGRVFPVREESLLIERFPIPSHFAEIVGIDFGWEHPFAAVRLAWDRDNDIVYVVSTYMESHATPPIHAAAIRPWGPWGVPVAWPRDGLDAKATGKPLASLYKDAGLKMLPEPATHEAGGNSVEAGLIAMLERMQSGRLKVMADVGDEGVLRGPGEWLEEFRMYHRKDGKVVKAKDDLMDATRYGIMELRSAKVRTAVRRVHRDLGANAWMG